MDKLKAFFASLWAKVKPVAELELEQIEAQAEAEAQAFAAQEAAQLNRKLGFTELPKK